MLSDVLGSFEDTGFYRDCDGCYRVGRVAGVDESWDFFNANRNAFELDSD
jgi:hypothetical protein